MDDAAREALAQRLSAMDFRAAVREMRAIDPGANMVFWRNSMWDEFLTRFLLPNAQLTVTLVEKRNVTESKKRFGGVPTNNKVQKFDYEYVGARVEPLDRPAYKRGGTGPSPMKRLSERGA